MKENSLVSVALATYNGEKYLKEQLDSIYAQTYKNIEVVVTDDGSADGTVEILEQYAQSHGLRYYVNEKNLGFVKNFEKAISLCSGEYIALSDQDDVWESNKLELLLENIGTNLLIHSDCMIIDERSRLLASSWKNKMGYDIGIEKLFFSNIVTGCTVLFDSKLKDMAYPFPPGLSYHDWWLALCAAKANGIAYAPLCLTRYRQHEAQDTGTGKTKKVFVIRRVLSDMKKRWQNQDFQRIIVSRKHLKNLYAARESGIFHSEYHSLLKDAILYYEDYLQKRIHIRTFLIGLKYHKVLYPTKNYLFLKNILNDIIG